jgi:hypothetical protein
VNLESGVDDVPRDVVGCPIRLTALSHRTHTMMFGHRAQELCRPPKNLGEILAAWRLGAMTGKTHIG